MRKHDPPHREQDFALSALEPPDPEKARHRWLSSAVLTVLLVLGLAVTSFAIGLSLVEVPGNAFRTGHIRLNLNDGRPVIQENEFAFEPGATIQKNFFLQNEGTWEVYYKLYFSDIQGDLADILDVRIESDGEILYSGKMSALTRRKVQPANTRLAVDQRREFTITFHFPENAGNEYKNAELTFELCADAVQTKNNPCALFS